MKFNNNQTLAESVVMRGLDLAESRRWKDYSGAIREGYKANHKTSIPDTILATTATLLENTYQYAARMDETTRTVNLGTFIDYGFDVISATVPNLIAHDIVSVQPMNAKHGAIFYLQYLYGSDKGMIKRGTPMNSPFTGAHTTLTGTGDDLSISHTPFDFSNNKVVRETIGEESKLMFTPIIPGTIQLIDENNNVIGEDKSNGDGKTGEIILASGGNSGSINYLDGIIQMPEGTSAVVTYRYNMDETNVRFSQVDLDLASISIEATPRKLRARWLLDAGFELQKMKGIDAESELVTAMSNEIKFEIDGELLNALYMQAGIQGKGWDCQNPESSLSYQEYKRTIIDHFTEMSNDIFQATKRVGANFIVAGVDVCNIIETLEEFSADSLGTKAINGPHKIGKLAGKWDVYKNPFYDADTFVLGYKGNSWLDAGFVYAPYMPLYATPTQVLDDFIFRKGLATSYGQVMLNKHLYAKGFIKNFSAVRMIPGATPEIG